MVDFIEIHNQLKEIREGACSSFFGFNEIKNILLEQNSFAELENKLQPLFKELTYEEKKEALPLLVTTTSAHINRYSCYEMSDILKEDDSTLNMSILKNLLDPYIEVPEDSFKALRENGYSFKLSLPIIDTILANSNWQKLSYLIPELQKLSHEEKQEVAEKLQALKPQASQNVHGIEVELFDWQTVLDAVKA
jgi:hypothetical protein